MFSRLLHVSALDGPVARNATVATTLPGDAAAVLAAVCIRAESLATNLLLAPVRSSKSRHPQLLAHYLLMNHHYHLSAPPTNILPTLSQNLQHHQAGLAAYSVIGGTTLRDNAGATHAGICILQMLRAP